MPAFYSLYHSDLSCHHGAFNLRQYVANYSLNLSREGDTCCYKCTILYYLRDE